MKIFDNVHDIVRDDLAKTIKKGSRVSIAAACFSMYAYQELKEQLGRIDEFRFIFTSPTFVTEREEKQKREFYIPKLTRENSLYGTEFEINLRNEMTQRAIAKECAQWISSKATFKSNTTGENMGGFIPAVPAVRTAAGDGAGGGEPAAAGDLPDPAPHDGLGSAGQPPPAAGGTESGQGLGEHRIADRGRSDGAGSVAGRSTRHRCTA